MWVSNNFIRISEIFIGKEDGKYLESSRRRVIGVSLAGDPIAETVGLDTCARISTGTVIGDILLEIFVMNL